MWNTKKYIVSQFVAMNQGKIIECYGKSAEEEVRTKRRSNILPFCTQNSGIVENIGEEGKDEKEEWIMENVIEIRSSVQLQEIAKQINTGDPFYYKGTYRLMADLDLQNMKWMPAGSSKDTPFSGIFDGNGHAVKNFSVSAGRSDCAGFFGYLKNARIRDLSIEGKVKGGRFTGAMAGIIEDSEVVSCFASAEVWGRYCTGGFIGKNSGEIAHCFYSGSVWHGRGILPV